MKNETSKKRQDKVQQGVVILIVLVAIVLLSFSAYVFAELMIVESVVSSTFAQETKARTAAESGVEYVAALLDHRQSSVEIDLHSNPDLFQNVSVSGIHGEENAVRYPAFCVVAPFGGKASKLRFGLVDESAKLNLNMLPLEKRRSMLARNMLLHIEEMTPQIADAILDWLDEDDEPREFGAEQSYYGSLSPPIQCRNSRISLLSDLLRVRGMTPALLFGEDVNHDGWLDASENDGADTAPVDNSDGVLDQGWSAKLTSFGGKSTFGANGKRKIDLNQPSLVDLYDQLARRLDENIARFVVAYRLVGPIESELFPSEDLTEYEDDLADAQRRSVEQTVNPDSVGTRHDLANRRRGGIDITSRPIYQIQSLYDLFGSAVQVVVDGEDTILDSPWPADPATIVSQIPLLDNLLDTRSGNPLQLLVNVNQCPVDVLLTVPGMTQELAKTIIGSRQDADSTVGFHRNSTAWLLYEGIVDFKKLRQIAPYITVRGDVFRADVVGWAGPNSPVARVSAVIDRTYPSTQVTCFRDLPVLSKNAGKYFTSTER